MSFSALGADVRRLARGLVALGVKPGDRVAILSNTRPEWTYADLGILLAGAVTVPVYQTNSPEECQYVLEHSGAAAVFCEDDEQLAKIAEIRDALPALRHALRFEGEGDDAMTLAGLRAAGEQVGDDDLDARVRAIGADDVATIVYTSGTTGPPKGAVLPRRAIASNLDGLAEAWEWSGDDMVAHGLPLFHVHGLILGTLGPVRRGGGVHHLGRFSAQAAASALDGDATMLFAVPTMYHRLAAEAEQDRDIRRALGNARLLVSGSAALPAVQHERIERLTGQRIAERYGMTETLMNTAVRASGERRPGYVGPPLTGVELRLVDDDGNTIEAADDETIGEIHVRGPNLFLEYLNRPDATAEAMTDGWFKTGDLATRAPDGYVRIVGRRATDLIKSGGFKIGAGEIEGALLEHPAVKEVAVTGEPDPDLGERIVAWVVAREGASPSEDELAGHVADLLTPHKRPRVVRFLDELPRNEMGKVQKKRLTA
jgi:malonyl-CoA/methylmalonyl-CoA synthetase